MNTRPPSPRPARRIAAAVAVTALLASAWLFAADIAAARPARPPAAAIPEEKPSTAYDTSPATLLAATGADRMAWRGWPLRIWIDGELPPRSTTDPVLTLSGKNPPLALPPRSPGLWWLSPEQTAALADGRHTLSAGGLTAAIEVASPPSPLSAEQDSERRFVFIAYALDRGETREARREADAWVAAAPKDSQAYVLLGDVLTAADDLPAALAAYQHALGLTSGRDHPDLIVRRKAGAALARLIAQLPSVPETSPAPAPRPPPAAPAAPPSNPSRPGQLPAPPAPAPSLPAAPLANLRWAVTARASSEYRTTDYGAARATGAPDVPRHGDHRNAWASKTPDSGEEWLDLTFPSPVNATEIHVVQSFNPGTLVRIDVIDAADRPVNVWNGPDETAYPKDRIGTLIARFPRTAQPVARVRLTLDTKKIPGWNSIDAVALVTAPQ